MTTLADAVDRLEAASDTIEGLRKDVQALTTWTRRRVVAVSIILGIVVALMIAVGVLALSNRSTAQHVANATVTAKTQAACVRDWANAYADRTNTLVPLSNARQDALDALIRTLPAAATKSPAQQEALFNAKLFAYLKASDAYSAAVQDNPPPLAPKFTC